MHERRQNARIAAERCEFSLEYVTSDSNFAKAEILDRLRLSFLNQAQIIFCTLSSAGLELLSNLNDKFQALIIDESAQSTELGTAVALVHDVKHCVLVGDPRYSQTAKVDWGS